MANTYLTRTPSSASNRRTFTISTWLKLGSLGGNTTSIFSAWYANSTVGHFVFRGSSDKFGWSQWSNDSYSTRLFRDVNGWYHVVLAVDTTQSTASNRIKLYVNGVQETSFADGPVYPSQNEELPVNNNNRQTIGSNYYSSNSNFFDGSMSHFHLIDGTAYDASAFGETDATTGEWKAKTSPSVTYGTNGFFILKDGNSVTDQSGRGNNFTVSGGTLTNLKDNPDNVFATLNPLWRSRWANDSIFEHGNTTLDNTASGRGYGFSTLGMTSGKYYFEAKCTEAGRIAVGVGDANFVQSKTNTWYSFNPSNAIGMIYDGGLYYNSTSNSAYHSSAIQNNDIVQIALDMDNYRMWFGINGTWLNSATQTQIENGTATYDVTTKIGTQNVINNGEPMHFFVADISNSGVGSASVNFGNGYFGTTVVSSAGTNASGNGIFEYDVPSGYTALSTKGLNT